jgi:hypothetical protein
VARHLVGALTGPSMQHNPIHLLEPMVTEAGFEQVDSGDLHPWIRYVTAIKPGAAR